MTREMRSQSQAVKGCEPLNGRLDLFWGWKGGCCLWGRLQFEFKISLLARTETKLKLPS